MEHEKSELEIARAAFSYGVRTVHNDGRYYMMYSGLKAMESLCSIDATFWIAECLPWKFARWSVENQQAYTDGILYALTGDEHYYKRYSS